MATRTQKISLVGMRFHSPSFDVFVEIKKCEPTLRRDPNNKHDPNAVEVLLHGEKVGYVDKDSAVSISRLLVSAKSYRVRVDSISKGSIGLSFIYQSSSENVLAPSIADHKEAGIYKISVSNDEHVYIGQTNSLNERIKAHWTDLETQSHSNKYLQERWNVLGASKFKATMLEKPPANMGQGLKLQRWLSEREQHWIAQYRRIGNCLNITVGELVPTKKAVEEFAAEQKDFDLRVKVEKKEIRLKIQSLEQSRTDNSGKLWPIQSQIELLKKQLFKNTGFIGYFCGSLTKAEVQRKKNELQKLENAAAVLTQERDALSKEIIALKAKHKGLKSTKQIEAIASRELLRFGMVRSSRKSIY